MTGVMKAYLGLAYDLYLCAHTAELPPLLLKRLPIPPLRSVWKLCLWGTLPGGISLSRWKMKRDSTISHCEFGSIQVQAEILCRSQSSNYIKRAECNYARQNPGKLFDALRKNAAHGYIYRLGRQQSMLDSSESD
jgi:hypothetical protein